jgi:class 3 adenylate cyclase
MIILVVDLSGYAQEFRSHSDSEMAAFAQEYYRTAGEVVEEQGGTIIKFMGDAVLSTFPPDAASEAVAAAITLQRVITKLATDLDFEVRLGANIYFSEAVAAELARGRIADTTSWGERSTRRSC